MCISNGATCVIVEMTFNVTADYASQGPDQVVNVPRRCASNRVCHAHAVDANAVHSLVKVKQVYKIGTE
jgi:hypothetical protein